jgi:hypothetical protein
MMHVELSSSNGKQKISARSAVIYSHWITNHCNKSFLKLWKEFKWFKKGKKAERNSE